MISVWGRAALLLSAFLAFVVLPVAAAAGHDAALLTLAGGLLLLLLRHLRGLSQLVRWLNGPIDAPVPEGAGIWEDVFAALHRRVRTRLAQQAVLASALERFRNAAEALPDGIVLIDRHGHIDWFNRQAGGHFALDRARDRGQPLTNLVRSPDFVAYLDAERYDEPLLYHSQRVIGQTLLVQVVPYGADQTLLISRDVSHVERLETMRRDFVANVSHELKTPLTVVSGFAETLLDFYAESAPGEARRYLEMIHAQASRMRRLIEDLLSLSALETGEPARGDETVAMTPLLEALREEAEALSGGRHDVVVDADPAVPALRGSAAELRSAFSNLVSNAVRYTPAGGRIDIAWRRVAAGAEFAVRDCGLGIAPEHLPRLTERFYRVDLGRSRETGGTGLGLAIVKHVLSRHQARLEIESQLGQGSRFAAVFPASRIAASPQP